MVIELMLVRDGRVLLRLPLSQPGASEESISLEESEVERLSDLFSIGSNRKRLRVIAELAKGKELRFSDVMQMVTNPKLAQDCLQPMIKQGLVVHEGRGSGYRLSQKALPLMAAMTVGMARLAMVLERESEAKQDE